MKIKQDGKGIWYCRKFFGRTPAGKQIQKYKRFPEADSREEAQALADEWERRITALGEFTSPRLVDLLGDYIGMCEGNGASPNSLRCYRSFTSNYVARFLKNADARDLTVVDFNRFEHDLLRCGGENGGALSRNTVNNVHHFLRAAYNYFVIAGVVEANPMISVMKPNRESHEAVSLDEADFAAADAALSAAMQPEAETPEALRDAAYAFAAWLSLRTGLRLGEACAVRRRDVMRMSRYVHVGGTVIEGAGKNNVYRRNVTKGHKCRNVAITRGDIERIDSFTAMQDRVRGEMKPDVPLVTSDGSYMRPTTVSRAFSRIRDECGMPKAATFHTLRHTHATWCLANGVDIKTLSERLGHEDPATTMRIYSHVMPGRDAMAADAFESAAARVTGAAGG